MALVATAQGQQLGGPQVSKPSKRSYTKTHSKTWSERGAKSVAVSPVFRRLSMCRMVSPLRLACISSLQS